MGRHSGKNRRCMVLGSFISMKEGRYANAVLWYVAMDKDIRTVLTGFLEEASRRRKKRPVIDVTQETDDNQPL